MLRKIAGLKFFEGEEQKSHLTIAKKMVRRLLADSDVREDDAARLRALLLRIGDGGFWAAETVISVGRLLHTSPIMTAREAVEALTHSRSCPA